MSAPLILQFVLKIKEDIAKYTRLFWIKYAATQTYHNVCLRIYGFLGMCNMTTMIMFYIGAS